VKEQEESMTAIIWMIAFAALVLVETFTLEFTSLSIAFGCLLAATAAWVGLGPAFQFGLMITGTVVGIAAIAPVLRKRALPAPTLTGVDSIVGAQALVTEAIRPPHQGKVKLDGVVWQAVSDHPIEEGTLVLVTELKGAQLEVIARGELEGPPKQLAP
jgi:membrane protein implicated in regulation of membrane protease activity